MKLPTAHLSHLDTQCLGVGVKPTWSPEGLKQRFWL
jgi:hypothetical protein